MPTGNVQVTNWVERISARVWTNYETTDHFCVTNTPNGVQFQKAAGTLGERLQGRIPISSISTTWVMHDHESATLGGLLTGGLYSGNDIIWGMDTYMTNWSFQYKGVLTQPLYSDPTLKQFFDHCLVLSNGFAQFYINGTLVLSTNYGVSGDTSWDALCSATGPSPSFQSYFDGYVREIAIWPNTNLNPVYIADLHNYAQEYWPLVITTQPSSVNCNTNDVVNFHLVSSTSPLIHYQWQSNGVNLANSPLWYGVNTDTLWVTNNGTVFTNLPLQCIITNLGNSVTSATVYLRAVDQVTNGLVLWWKLNEGAGTNAFDSSGNTNTGTLVGSPTWVAGAIGNAVQFNGSSQWIIKSNANSFPTGDAARTYSCWVNATQASQGMIMGNGAQANGQFWGNYYNPNVSVFGFFVTAWANDLNTLQSYSYSTWYNYTSTYTNGSMAIYVNGNLVTNKVSAALSTANSDFGVGGRPDLQNFTGKIDDVRVYNRLLSTNEINQLYLIKP